jgi:Transposase DDE domain
LLKLLVQHAPTLLAFLCGGQLRLTKPPLQHGLRLAEALMVSEARHKTLAGFSRLMVDAPDPSKGADTLRIRPWTAEDLRAPLRHCIVADLVAYAHQTDEWTL